MVSHFHYEALSLLQLSSLERLQRSWQLTCPAVVAHPALQANLCPGLLASIVAKVVIARNTQLVALVAVVVVVTPHPDTVDEASHGPVVQDGLPLITGVDHTGANAAFD